MPQVQVIQPIQQQPKRLRVAAYPTPAFCSRSVMICNVVVESACIGIPKRINGTVVTVECGRIEFAQKNSLSNFVKSYSGFVGIMNESALHRAQAISTPSNLPG